MREKLSKQKEKEGFSFWILRLLVSEKKLQEISSLYSGKTKKELREQLGKELLKQLFPVILISIGLLIICIFMFFQEEVIDNQIERPNLGNVIKEELLLEKENDIHTIEIEITSKEYTEEEIEERYIKAKEYLDSVILNQNENFLKITDDLYFPSSIPTTGEEISWSTNSPWLITSDGVVCNETLEMDTFVEIQAKISYGSEYRIYTKGVTVLPKVYTPQEQELRDIKEYLQQVEKQTRTEKMFEVPKQVFGWNITKQEKGGFSIESFLLLLAIVIPILIYSRFFEQLESLQKQRKEQAERSYSEFITKLSLLLAAGISVRQCFFRLAKEYEENYGEEHVLTIELKRLKQELEYGHSESVVYDTFGRRIGILPYQRMASLLTQNVSKGIQGIRVLLLQEAKEVMAEERAKIKIKGEQAGTKLLVPMMVLLVLVFAILLVPAFQTL